MPKSAVLVTAAEISRLAGVTRATVSNWRRRHTDFPTPAGGTESSPAYDLADVRGWLSARGQMPEASAADELRTALRGRSRDDTTSLQLLPLVLAAHRMTPSDVAAMIERTGTMLATQASRAVAAIASEVPGASKVTYRVEQSDLVRLVLTCVRDEGAFATVDVLVETAGDDSRKTGTYATPTPLADLMAALAATPGKAFPRTVFDPACGAGGLLAAAARAGATHVCGQDATQVQAAQAAVKLAVLEDAARTSVVAGDSLRDDAFPDLRADVVLCNPPYGDRGWGHEELAYDSRWTYGLAPKGEPELAWVQHCLAHLEPGALAIIVMPPGSAARPAGRRIRAGLARDGALRAVIALPPGTAPPLHIGLHLWILRRPHPDEPAPPHVLFVDTRAESDWSTLRDAIVETWHQYVHNGHAESGDARAVPVVDLLDDHIDLTPARHVHSAPHADEPDQQAAAAIALRDMLRRATTGLAALNTGAQWQPTGAKPRTWRTATVADLTRGGALTILRGPTHAIRHDDIILTELVRPGTPPTRVAGPEDSGQALKHNHIVLRPDPQRLDPWFLAGFLATDDNLHSATTGTTVLRLDPRRLRIPLITLDEQREYGKAFRHLDAITTTAAMLCQLAGETTRTLGAGLTSGALLPPTTQPDPE